MLKISLYNFKYYVEKARRKVFGNEFTAVSETVEGKNGRGKRELCRGGRNRLINIKKRFLSQSAESKQSYF